MSIIKKYLSLHKTKRGGGAGPQLSMGATPMPAKYHQQNITSIISHEIISQGIISHEIISQYNNITGVIHILFINMSFLVSEFLN